MKLYFDVMPYDLFFNVLYQIQKVILEIVPVLHYRIKCPA